MSASILLVMDMINDLVHPEGPNAKTYGTRCPARGVFDTVAGLIARARAAAVPVGYVRIGFSSNYAECPPGSPVFAGARKAGLLKLGDWGTEVYAPLAPHAGDADIVKHRVSPFYGTKLEPLLRAKDLRRLILCGVSTNGVVSAAAREGHDRDYACVVVEDGCEGATDTEHSFALEGLKRFAEIRKADEVTF